MALEPDVALLMAAFVKKYVKICLKMLKIWLSQPKRLPTPALENGKIQTPFLSKKKTLLPSLLSKEVTVKLT